MGEPKTRKKGTDLGFFLTLTGEFFSTLMGDESVLPDIVRSLQLLCPFGFRSALAYTFWFLSHQTGGLRLNYALSA